MLKNRIKMKKPKDKERTANVARRRRRKRKESDRGERQEPNQECSGKQSARLRELELSVG